MAASAIGRDYGTISQSSVRICVINFDLGPFCLHGRVLMERFVSVCVRLV
jgi:hypothetical protein